MLVKGVVNMLCAIESRVKVLILVLKLNLRVEMIFNCNQIPATAETPHASFVRQVVNLSSSLQQQQQWSGQNSQKAKTHVMVLAR